MFLKLLKHEFRATSPFVLLVWLGLVVFSGLSTLFRVLCDSLDIFVLPMAVTTTFFALLAVASVVIVYVVIIRRFYTNVYGDEGYLTLTLPVKRGSIITTKLICGAVLVIGTLIVLGISVLIQFAPEFYDMIEWVFGYFFIFVDQIVHYTGIPIGAAVAEAILYLLVALAKSILVFYASVSIGQFFTGHRLLGSVLGYLCVNVASKTVVTVYSLIMGISAQATGIMRMFAAGQVLDNMTSFEVQISFIVWIILTALFAAVLWLFTDVIMRKAVNLQ